MQSSNSKKRKCFGAKVYKAAEKYHARIRPNTTDGTGYDNDKDDLKIKLFFEDDVDDFQSALREIPSDIAISDSVAEVYISESDTVGLRRIFYFDYQSQTDDPNRSAMCDTASDFTDSSCVSAVFVNDAV